MKHSIARICAFVNGDYRSVLRDSMMMVIFVSPLIMGLGVRIIIPYIFEQILNFLKFDFTQYMTGIAGFLLQIPPLMYGMVAGFIILDERDDGVLQYLTVTPLSRTGYLVYRISMPAIAGTVASALFLLICDLVQYFTFRLLPLFFLAALGAPLVSLLLASFAHDKVEALTLAKAASFILIPGFVVFFTDSPLQFLCGITPSFWVIKATLAMYAHDPLYLVYVGTGVIVTVLYIWMLVRRFSSKVL